MTQARICMFLLAVMSAVAAVEGNTCSLEPITWSCPAQPPLLSLGFTGITVEECGKTYTKDLFTTLTSLTYNETLDKDKTYTAAMVDPDAPGHEGGQAWLHWIRAGLTSADLEAGTMTAGQDIISYNPPTPPQGTGIHRYLVFVFEEAQPVQKEDIKKRGKFDLAAYATRQQLCGPVASNMFQTQY